MTFPVRVLIGIVSTVLLLFLAHYLYVAIRHPESIDHREFGYSAYVKQMAYFTTVTIAFLTIIYCGLYSHFCWIPESIEQVTEDGRTPLRVLLAGSLTILSTVIAGTAHRYVIESSKYREAIIVISELERFFPKDAIEIERSSEYYLSMSKREDAPPSKKQAYKDLYDLAQVKLPKL